MRRAAMIDLFEQAGLELLPAQIWPYVQSQPTIDAAALRFLADVGLDGAAIMRGEKAALRRANALLLLLAEIEGAFSRLAPGAKNRLERALFSGNLAKVRAAVEIVAAYEAIVRMLDRWPDDRRFPAFRAFAAAIQAELGDPLASSRDDADEAQKIADDLSRVMGQIDHAGRRYAVVVDTLEAADYGSWATATDVVREMALIESLFTEIRDTDLATSDIVALLAAIDAAIDKLEAALRAHGGTGRGSRGGGRSGATADPVLTELEQALLFFGYSKADRPTWDDIQSRYKDRIKSVHPDLGGSEAATKELNGHRDILRRAFKPG